ncbi:MAG: hypothetical protein WDA10_02720 [Porticoccaceae bacterium]
MFLEDKVDSFIFKGVKAGQALVGLLVTEKEVHDFLMTEHQIDGNMRAFGESRHLLAAKEALGAASLADVR